MTFSRPTPKTDSILFLVALILGLLRFPNLGQESFWLDEAKGAMLAFTPFEAWWDQLPEHQAPPGHFLILRLMGEWGRSETLLRLPSAVAGWLCLLVVWRIGKSLEVPSPGLPVLLLAVSPLFFHFSREARCYTFWTLAELVVWSSFLRWYFDSSNRMTALLCGWLFPLPLLLHYHALWFLLGRLPWVLLLLRRCDWKTRAHFLSAALCSATLVFPWLFHQIAALPPANPRVITGLGDLSLPFWTRKLGEFYGFDYPIRFLGWAFLSGSLVGGFAWFRKNRHRRETLPFLMSVAIPPILIVAATVFADRYLAVRHLLPLLPVALLFLPGSWPGFPKLGWVSVLIVFPCVLYGLSENFRDFREVDRPPWREISEFLAENRQPGKLDCVVGDNVRVVFFYRDCFGIPTGPLREGFGTGGGSSFSPSESADIQGLLLSGQTEEAQLLRNGLAELDEAPLREWTSRRISPIQYFKVDSQLLDLLQKSIEKKVGSHAESL